MLRDGHAQLTQGGTVEPIFLLVEVAVMRDKDNGKANVPNIDKSYEEVAT